MNQEIWYIHFNYKDAKYAIKEGVDVFKLMKYIKLSLLDRGADFNQDECIALAASFLQDKETETFLHQAIKRVIIGVSGSVWSSSHHMDQRHTICYRQTRDVYQQTRDVVCQCQVITFATVYKAPIDWRDKKIRELETRVKALETELECHPEGKYIMEVVKERFEKGEYHDVAKVLEK